MFSSLHPSVMVVDDEKELAELYSRFLQICGFGCIHFTDPREALDYFSKNFESYILVITDLEMPNFNGLELAQRFRKYNKSVKILLVTALLVKENLNYDRLKEAGIDMVIEKPFRLQDLRPIINGILTR